MGEAAAPKLRRTRRSEFQTDTNGQEALTRRSWPSRHKGRRTPTANSRSKEMRKARSHNREWPNQPGSKGPLVTRSAAGHPRAAVSIGTRPPQGGLVSIGRSRVVTAALPRYSGKRYRTPPARSFPAIPDPLCECAASLASREAGRLVHAGRLRAAPPRPPSYSTRTQPLSHIRPSGSRALGKAIRLKPASPGLAADDTGLDTPIRDRFPCEIADRQNSRRLAVELCVLSERVTTENRNGRDPRASSVLGL